MLSGILIGMFTWVGTVIFCCFFFTSVCSIAFLILTFPFVPLYLQRQAKIRKEAALRSEEQGSWREDLVRMLKEYRACFLTEAPVFAISLLGLLLCGGAIYLLLPLDRTDLMLGHCTYAALSVKMIIAPFRK